jgi:hypothetical protein
MHAGAASQTGTESDTLISYTHTAFDSDED